MGGHVEVPIFFHRDTSINHSAVLDVAIVLLVRMLFVRRIEPRVVVFPHDEEGDLGLRIILDNLFTSAPNGRYLDHPNSHILALRYA